MNLSERFVFSAIWALVVGCTTGSRSKRAITDTELEALADRLWNSDAQRASKMDVVMDWQARTNYNTETDKSQRRLFSQVSLDVVHQSEYELLVNLYPFYDAKNGQPDNWSSAHKDAIEKFLTAMIDSGPVKELRSFMKDKDYPEAATDRKFKDYLYQLWFASYSRQKGVQDSSGFEHVFMEELKSNPDELVGLHSWIRIYTLEREGKLDYAGYTKHHDHIASIVYRIRGQWKSSSLFIRTSPAYDFAVYTMCFIFKSGKNGCSFELPDCSHVQVTTYKLKQNDKTHIGTAYANSVGEPKCTRHHSHQTDAATTLPRQGHSFAAIALTLIAANALRL